MSQSIANWFTSITNKSTAAAPPKQKKKRSARKRKRRSDDDDDDDEYQPNETSTKTNHKNPKRRKLNNTKAKAQKNSLLSFISKRQNDKIMNNNNDKASAEESSTISKSRYGRKRKKVNYSLTSLWGITSPKKDEIALDDEYKVESDTNQHSSDEECMIVEDTKSKSNKRSTAKRKSKNKAKSKRKSSKAKIQSVADNKQDDFNELTQTFFMSAAEKRQYKREKVMSEFAEDLARRNQQDKKLFSGKKINPFFEMTKNRQKLAQTSAKEEISQHAEAPLFPIICSVHPQAVNSNACAQTRDVSTNSKTNEMYTIDDEFDFEMKQIEVKIADLLYCKHDDRTQINTIANKRIDLTIDEDEDEDEEANEYISSTTYWTSAEALDSYCESSDFQIIIHQISRVFPNMDHKLITNEVRMCLYRSVADKQHTNILWCDKYKPSKAEQVIGNWLIANDLKSWLKAWSNAAEKESYLVDINTMMNDEYYFSDEYDEFAADRSREKDVTLRNIALLTGPTACGKTAAVYAVANELQYTVIEVNCSTIKTGKDLNDQIGEATQSQQVKSTCVRSMVLLEEVDHMLESAPSIIRSIAYFVKTSRCPMILTAQQIPQSLANLNLKHFQFKYGALDRLALRTHCIALAEGICVTRREIEAILLFFDCDVRCAWTHLQFWLNSPRTFSHFNGAKEDSKIYLPLPRNEDIDASIDDDIYTNASIYNLSIYQRIIGCADISYNSCNDKHRLFWTQFVESFASLDDTQNNIDDLYCCMQHVLDSSYTHDIVFNSFPFWFMNDISLDAIKYCGDLEAESESSANAFRYSWTESEATRAAQSVINALIENVCCCDSDDIEMKINKINYKSNTDEIKHATEEECRWLQDWRLMIDTLSHNDIVCVPRGYCVNSSYHDRLRPHTMNIIEDAIDLCWENVECAAVENNANDKCQIYDTIQHEYLKQHIAPYMVTLAVTFHDFNEKKNNNNNNNKFVAQFTNDWMEKQKANRLDQYSIARSFRQHSAEGNFDFPSSRAWFDHYHDFICTICINEHHREKKGGSQYKHGRALRRSRRNQNTFFEHILEGWITKHESQQIVKEWILKFDGMKCQRNTLPTL